MKRFVFEIKFKHLRSIKDTKNGQDILAHFSEPSTRILCTILSLSLSTGRGLSKTQMYPSNCSGSFCITTTLEIAVIYLDWLIYSIMFIIVPLRTRDYNCWPKVQLLAVRGDHPVSLRGTPAALDFLHQDYRYKSVSTQIARDAILATFSLICLIKLVNYLEHFIFSIVLQCRIFKLSKYFRSNFRNVQISET